MYYFISFFPYLFIFAECCFPFYFSYYVFHNLSIIFLIFSLFFTVWSYFCFYLGRGRNAPKQQSKERMFDIENSSRTTAQPPETFKMVRKSCFLCDLSSINSNLWHIHYYDCIFFSFWMTFLLIPLFVPISPPSLLLSFVPFPFSALRPLLPYSLPLSSFYYHHSNILFCRPLGPWCCGGSNRWH